MIAGGRIDNEAGLIRSGENTTLSASSVSNTNTQGSDQGIEAHNLSVTADTLTNARGAIRTNADATIVSAGTVDNTSGLISAKGALRIVDPQAATTSPKALELVNASGTLKAGENLLLDAAGFSGDGIVVSDKDLSIALSKDVVNNGAVSAAGTLSYVTTGTFTNNSKLHATQTLTVGGADVLNNAGAEMSAGQKTVVSASGTLTNRGLIDGVDTQVNASTLDNLGTGRIYGDRISLLATGTLNNGAETVNGVTSTLGELMVATYEQKMASTFGYTNADQTYAEALQGRGAEATVSMGHSRGTIVQTNAFNIAAENGYTNPGLVVEGVGMAVPASTYIASATKVLGKDGNASNITATYMTNDPVSVIAAGNPGDAMGAIFEFYNVMKTSNSAHSCYGTGAAGCATIANPVPGGPLPTNQHMNNVQVIRGASQ